MTTSEITPSSLQQLAAEASTIVGEALIDSVIANNELTITIQPDSLKQSFMALRDRGGFEQLSDLCGIDYSGYGAEEGASWQGDRYAVIYHLISYQHNCRLRVRVPVSESQMVVDSVIDVWAGADWFEREAFDLFGIIFNGHPDLRRILTDYGFIGHPFRKDFPLSGQVEMRYDEEQERVIYQPVTIAPRTLVPRTIRKDVFNNTSAGTSNTDATEAN